MSGSGPSGAGPRSGAPCPSPHPTCSAPLDTRPDDAGVEAALVRYVTRMASRPTPFGLFAACGHGVVGDRTTIRLPEPASWGRFTQLDADYLDALVRLRATALRDRLTLTPNDSLHLHGRALALRRIPPRRARADATTSSRWTAPPTSSGRSTRPAPPAPPGPGGGGGRRRRRRRGSGRRLRRPARRRPGAGADPGRGHHRPAATRRPHRRPGGAGRRGHRRRAAPGAGGPGQGGRRGAGGRAGPP